MIVSPLIRSSEPPQHLLFSPHTVPQILCPFSRFSPPLFPLPPSYPPFLLSPSFYAGLGFPKRLKLNGENLHGHNEPGKREKEREEAVQGRDGDTDAGRGVGNL